MGGSFSVSASCLCFKKTDVRCGQYLTTCVTERKRMCDRDKERGRERDVYVYVYVYAKREREREREREHVFV